MVILAVMALIVEAIITLVENRLVKWRPVPFDGHWTSRATGRREPDFDREAAPGTPAGCDRAARRLRHLFDDGEAEAASGGLGAGDPVEALEDPLFLALRQPGAVIHDRQHRLTAPLDRPRR